MVITSGEQTRLKDGCDGRPWSQDIPSEFWNGRKVFNPKRKQGDHLTSTFAQRLRWPGWRKEEAHQHMKLNGRKAGTKYAGGRPLKKIFVSLTICVGTVATVEVKLEVSCVGMQISPSRILMPRSSFSWTPFTTAIQLFNCSIVQVSLFFLY